MGRSVSQCLETEDGDSLLELVLGDGGQGPDEIGDALQAASVADSDVDEFTALNYATQLFHNAITLNGCARWILPALFGLNLRLFRCAAQADDGLVASGQKPRCLEEAARTMNKAFSVCATDRFNPIQASRKWGAYYMCNMLFRTYFRLKQINLAANLIRSLKSVDLPALEEYPIAHVVTYRYYMGVLAFYDEQYKRAQEELIFALQNFPPLTTPTRVHNHNLLLVHLIPVNLLSGRIPASNILQPHHPQLVDMYTDLISAIGSGRLGDFDALLDEKQNELIRRGVFLTMERCRIVCFRNLARRIFLIRNKTTRLDLNDILLGAQVAGCDDVSMDQIECLVANLIDKGFVKGYISHEKLTLVLSPNNAFPALTSVPFSL
ncbi:PCI-domain-containing protein [Chytriomyces cf. hyalinus JEL632]|nr:PCI-domain-containing protein [Chytriomyces cf. hyalinus JEL632]